MAESISNLLERVKVAFESAFGRTPQRQRLEDILGEAIELSRCTDRRNLKEEAGDLLTSLLMLHVEEDLDPTETIAATIQKIERRKQQYASLGRKVKVALLGGAFDPPTIGHIAVARFVLKSSRAFDEVWLVPCNKHLYGKSMADAQHRLAMCKIAIRNDGPIRVCDYEIANNLAGSSFHLAKRLLAEDFAQHNYDFSMIIGMDNANTFDRWYEHQDLERMMRFVVVPRQGEQRKPGVDWYLKPPHIFLEPDENPLPETSSDATRKLIRSATELCLNDDLLKLLDPAVFEYIAQNNLYRKSES